MATGAARASRPISLLDLEVRLGSNADRVDVAIGTCKMLQHALALLQQSLDNLDRVQGLILESEERQAIEHQLASLRSQLSVELARIADTYRSLGDVANEAREAGFSLEQFRGRPVATQPR
ncbi:hypothetical protein JQ632_27810 [Bradyrhizobium liaoningense]|nr:hypothetical protein [Bradyrhizobium liaoningense]